MFHRVEPRVTVATASKMISQFVTYRELLHSVHPYCNRVVRTSRIVPSSKMAKIWPFKMFCFLI